MACGTAASNSIWERTEMPKDSTPVEKLSQLAQKAQSFFEMARGEPTNAWRLSEWTWGRLSREQQAVAERLGHDLRQQMALLVPAIQNAPLLDKRDLARFSRLGRTMDAALRFQPFRTRLEVDPRASRVFQRAYDEMRRLLEFVPLQGYFELSMVDRPPNRLGRNYRNAKFPVKTQPVK
jgi:hypothetical protein